VIGPVESFLVRLWSPDPGEPVADPLRGVVRRVTTGEERVFASEAELLGFLRTAGSEEPEGSDPRPVP
jgi:hypothetical protein